MLTMKTTCTPPLIHSLTTSADTPTPSTILKSRCEGTRKYSRQQLTARKASSASRAANMVKMLLPIVTPSRFRYTKASPLPPTAEGVTAEVNSQSTLTRKLCMSDSLRWQRC